MIAISKNSKKTHSNLTIGDRRINPHDFLFFLDWTHIQRIMRVSDPKARVWYLKEAVEQSWDVRTLDRNISTQEEKV